MDRISSKDFVKDYGGLKNLDKLEGFVTSEKTTTSRQAKKGLFRFGKETVTKGSESEVRTKHIGKILKQDLKEIKNATDAEKEQLLRITKKLQKTDMEPSRQEMYRDIILQCTPKKAPIAKQVSFKEPIAEFISRKTSVHDEGKTSRSREDEPEVDQKAPVKQKISLQESNKLLKRAIEGLDDNLFQEPEEGVFRFSQILVDRDYSPKEFNEVASHLLRNMRGLHEEMNDLGILKLRLSDDPRQNAQYFKTLSSPEGAGKLNIKKDLLGNEGTFEAVEAETTAPSRPLMKQMVARLFDKALDLSDQQMQDIYNNLPQIKQEIGDRIIVLRNLKPEIEENIINILSNYKSGDLKFETSIFNNEAIITHVGSSAVEIEGAKDKRAIKNAKSFVEDFVQNHMPGLSLEGVNEQDFPKIKAGIERFSPELGRMFKLDCNNLTPNSTKDILNAFMLTRFDPKHFKMKKVDWSPTTYQLTHIPGGKRVEYIKPPSEYKTGPTSTEEAIESILEESSDSEEAIEVTLPDVRKISPEKSLVIRERIANSLSKHLVIGDKISVEELSRLIPQDALNDPRYLDRAEKKIEVLKKLLESIRTPNRLVIPKDEEGRRKFVQTVFSPEFVDLSISFNTSQIGLHQIQIDNK